MAEEVGGSKNICFQNQVSSSSDQRRRANGQSVHRHCCSRGLGLLKGTLVKIHVRECYTALLQTTTSSVRSQGEGRKGTGEAVELPEWAALIVPAMKHDGSIRLCGNYS